MAAPKKRTKSPSTTHLVVMCLSAILLMLLVCGICALFSGHPQSTRVWDIISYSITAVVSGFLGMIATSRR